MTEEAQRRREAASILGQAKSDAKKAAARENGKKGGWPKGKKRPKAKKVSRVS